MAEIPLELRKKWITDGKDMDAALFTMAYDEPCPSRVLVVGAHDEPTANMLADMGNDVTGVDMRGYDNKLMSACNYRFHRGDFCDPELFRHSLEDFDVFVSLSTIEHFGMGAYREGPISIYYDVLAMRKAWELLKYGGKAYITVPTGSQFMEVWPHWRIYDLHSLRDRLIQDFKPLTIYASTADDITINGKTKKKGEMLTEEEVSSYSGIPPSVSTLVVMEKVRVHRGL